MSTKTFKAEENADLEFTFPKNLGEYELDKQGVKLPTKMKFVDIVIERENDILLIEIKDPSHAMSDERQRKAYLKKLRNDELITQELTPKARDSYTYLHLMERDTKPFVYIVLLGLDAFDTTIQQIALTGFKDRLLADIKEESHEAWKRKHISDCAVYSVATWNKYFPDWPITRLSATAAN